MNEVIRSVTLTVVAILILVCIYVFYDAGVVAESTKLSEEMTNVSPSGDDYDIISWRELSSNIIGWIMIDDTSINYPIMQSSDNEYYLSRDYSGDYSIAGSIFLDYRDNILDCNLCVLYGHRMSLGGMFSDVARFSDDKYFNEHRKGRFYDENRMHELEVVAFAKIKATTTEIYGSHADYMAAIDIVKLKSKYPVVYERGMRYILLSTCSAENKNLRNVILARYK